MWIRAGSTPAYFRRSASSAARLPLHVARRMRRRDELEVGVPDPRHVAAVGGVVVEHAEQVEVAVLERERAQHLVGAGRVLDEQDRERAPGDVDRLGAPERGVHLLQGRRDGLQRRPEGQARAAAPSALYTL